MSRRPPLHTIGAAILAVVHDACSRAKNVTGPVGFFAKTTSYMMKSGLPLIYSVQYQWLMILLFTDDCILAVETVAEKVFPPLAVVFDAVDGVVRKAETFPAKFDNVLDNWPEISLYWKVPGGWNFWAREKDVMMDGCLKPRRQISDQFPRLKPCHETKKDRKDTNVENSIEEEDGSLKCSYKEVLKKKTNEDEEEVDKDGHNEGDLGLVSPTSNDPILKLYDSSWHTK